MLDEATHRVTAYDHAHNNIYIRLLDAAFDGASHHDMARNVLDIDPTNEPERAWSAVASHLARAFWMMRVGWMQMVD